MCSPKGKSPQWEAEVRVPEKCGVAELVFCLQRLWELCPFSVCNPSVDDSPHPGELLTNLLTGPD